MAVVVNVVVVIVYALVVIIVVIAFAVHIVFSCGGRGEQSHLHLVQLRLMLPFG